MLDNPSTLRRAAILIDSLDSNTADALMDQMPAHQSARIRQAVMELATVHQEERDRVIQQFLRGDQVALETTDSGIELDDSLAAKIRSEHTDTPPAIVTDTTPFRFLHEAAGKTLASFLRHEHPQTVAVVVSHLPPGRASDLLAQLPADVQTEVLRRVAQLDEADPEIIREVERELEASFSAEIRTIQRRSAGLAAVKAILNAADSDQRERMLANLTDHDHQLASQILSTPAARSGTKLAEPMMDRTAIASDRAAQQVHSTRQAATRSSTTGTGTFASSNSAALFQRGSGASPDIETAARLRGSLAGTAPVSLHPPNKITHRVPPVTTRTEVLTDCDQSPNDIRPDIQLSFDDLAGFDDSTLAQVLQRANRSVTLLALTGARREFVDRILQQLPVREANSLRKKIQDSGPLRLRDVDQAQLHLAQIAAQLAAEGKITVSSTSGRTMAA